MLSVRDGILLQIFVTPNGIVEISWMDAKLCGNGCSRHHPVVVRNVLALASEAVEVITDDLDLIACCSLWFLKLPSGRPEEFSIFIAGIENCICKDVDESNGLTQESGYGALRDDGREILAPRPFGREVVR